MCSCGGIVRQSAGPPKSAGRKSGRGRAILWHGSDFIYTKISPRPGSDFIYTKNMGGRCWWKWLFYNSKMHRALIIFKENLLIYEKIFRAARAHMLRFFKKWGGDLAQKKQLYNSKMHVAIFLRKLNWYMKNFPRCARPYVNHFLKKIELIYDYLILRSQKLKRRKHFHRGCFVR